MTYQQLKTDLKNGDVQLRFPYKLAAKDKRKIEALLADTFPNDFTTLFGHLEIEGYTENAVLHLTGSPHGLYTDLWKVSTRPRKIFDTTVDIEIIDYTRELW